MKESFLHYIWQYKKFNLTAIKTTTEEEIVIKSVGILNTNTGPDFFNAQMIIGNQEWAGNIEIHVKASDWYLHNHEKDSNYDNVILHVVWEDDAEIYRKDNTIIPTLQLKNYVLVSALSNYQKLFSNKNKWINCENEFEVIDSFVLNNWLERLYIERLEEKSAQIIELLNNTKNDWEAVLFQLLAKSFGLKVNSEAFLSMAKSFDFSIVKKLQSKHLSLEALFFGQLKLLEGEVEETYYNSLKEEYHFLKTKFNLQHEQVNKVQFFRLRPANFPTLRLSQLAGLYYKESALFAKLINIKHVDDFYKVFSIETSSFWETHYTFTKASKTSKKQLSKSFIDLLIVNTIIPLQFTYAKYIGKTINDEVLAILQSIKPEKNSIVDKFMTLNQFKSNALLSQALIQLKNKYCDNNRCLECAVGNVIIAS